MVKKLLFIGLFIICLPYWLQAQVVDKVGFVERGKASYFADNRGGIFTASGERYNMNELVAAHPFIAFNSYVRVTNLDNGRSVVVRINDRGTARNHIIELSKAAAERIGATGRLSFDAKIEIVPNPAVPAAVERPIQQPEATQEWVSDNFYQRPQSTSEATGEKEREEKESRSQRTLNQGIASDQPQRKEKTLKERFWDVGTYTIDGMPVKPLGYGVQAGWFSKAEEAVSMARRFQNLQFGNIYIQSGWEKGQKAYRVLLGSFASKDDTKNMVDFLNERHYNAFPRKHYDVE